MHFLILIFPKTIVYDTVSYTHLDVYKRQRWALPGAKQALGLTNDFCNEYLNAFSSLYPQLRRQIIHRDPNPGNMICSEDQWGFIDFDLAERNARIYDCLLYTSMVPQFP